MEYLTVAEVAKLSGVSNQAVYQRLSTSLKDLYKEIDGRKMLHSSAVEVIKSGGNQSTFNQDSTMNQSSLDSTIKLLEATIETLRDQLIVKDDQIKELNKRLEQAMTITQQNNFIAAQKSIEESSQKNTEDNIGDIISDEQHGADDVPDEENKLPWYKRIFQ